MEEISNNSKFNIKILKDKADNIERLYAKAGLRINPASELWKLMESKTRQGSGNNNKVPPPEVAVEWGVFKFVSVITNMTQRFTLFKQDGTPVRAKVEVTFTQHKDVNDYPSQNPTSGGGPLERVHTVIAGDRLDTIAYAAYGDSTKWRLIAEHNNIDNPFALRTGEHIAIPMD